MEPIDTDFDYVVRQSRERRPVSRNSRFNIMLIIPALGLVWLLYLLGAFIFQWPVTDVVNPVMSIMILVFIVSVALLFWAMAPNQKR